MKCKKNMLLPLVLMNCLKWKEKREPLMYIFIKPIATADILKLEWIDELLKNRFFLYECKYQLHNL